MDDANAEYDCVLLRSWDLAAVRAIGTALSLAGIAFEERRDKRVVELGQRIALLCRRADFERARAIAGQAFAARAKLKRSKPAREPAEPEGSRLEWGGADWSVSDWFAD
jgi:hypothetical protein